VTAPARLLGLRVQGFKSFAERTLVEFGPGISAVVGPNGSGKSNLADSLRWALGEQGRSLRIRRSEDVIWAGSERRGAQGMADVTIVLDNADALLPVEYSVVELGRRLYRSGENDYLLNRQRVRLRDLVDLLDSANLAENAFLFIGQGMVDQALSLRPEERRPLFEEVAGVRRHERRRRKAEAQLAEAEDNLARVDDILAELRPQARRLGRLAEQQATRITAGEELAAALITAAQARWHEAAARVRTTEARLDELRAETAAALSALEQAESVVGELAGSMAARADLEHEYRARHEIARAAVTELGLRQARAEAEVAAIARDRIRLGNELAGREAELAQQRRALAAPVPDRDLALEASVVEADQALAEALGELGALRAATRARGEELAALRRAEAARAAETETARRQVADAERRAGDLGRRLAEIEERRSRLEAQLALDRDGLAAAQTADASAAEERVAAQTALEAAEGARRAVADQAASAGSALATARGRLETLERRLAEDQERGIARAAKRLGGRRVDDSIAVDPDFRATVEAALGDLLRAYVVEQRSATRLGGERGQLVVRERLETVPRNAAGSPAGATPTDQRRLEEMLGEVGGGRLTGAIRADPEGVVRALLARAVWAPDLEAVLRLQPVLPVGWIAVARDGGTVVDPISVRLGRGDAVLERRAEAERLAREVDQLEVAARSAEAAAAVTAADVTAARARLDAARAAESSAAAARRRAEEAERRAGRELEAAAREAAWLDAQRATLSAEVERSRSTLDALVAPPEASLRLAQPEAASTEPDRDALATWEQRVTDLRARRERLALDAAAADGARREAEARRARAEATIAMMEARREELERELAALSDRERDGTGDQGALASEMAAAQANERAAREALDTLLADDRHERARLADAERAAMATRDRLRLADERARTSDVAAMEARLALDQLREQVLVELAGLGEVGLRHLALAAGMDPADLAGRSGAFDALDGPERAAAHADRQEADASTDDEAPGDDSETSIESAALEAALDALAPTWAESRPPVEVPTPGRLTVLRRRYHELGAANPFAVDEYRTVRERLETLDTQHADLRDAITRTRALIADLDTLITTQFRTTFAALEVAFDARFRQLFGGGFAKLALTDPSDLASTGIEITARPPGKKPQSLSMLSGGERALTAVALLFAMLEVRPAPFCVLDEVDAALDEANVGRFTDALRSLAEQTQFIVITHNRGTIEVADALYGVTVGDDSVSRVISLRLDEAQAIADHRRSDARVALAGEAGD
jgi:chromosome segregation protein